MPVGEGTSLRGIEQLIEWFVPPASSGEENRLRAWRVAIATFALIPVALLFMVFDLFSEEVPEALPLGLGAAALYGGAILAVLKAMRSHWQAGHMLCAGLLATLGWQCVLDSGLDNPSTVLALLVPWIAAVCLGRRASYGYAALTTLFFAGLYALNAAGHDFFYEAGRAKLRIHFLVLYLGTAWTMAIIGHLYEERRREARAAVSQASRSARELGASADTAGLRPEVVVQFVGDLRPLVLDTVGLSASLAGTGSRERTTTLSAEGNASPNGKPGEDAGAASAATAARHGSLIEANGHRLLAMLDAAGELAELERSGAPSPPETVDLHAAVEEALAPLQRSARERGIHLWIESSSSTSPRQTVQTNRELAGRLATLLAKSAMAGLREGQVTVGVGPAEGGGAQLRVEADGRAAANGALPEDAARLQNEGLEPSSARPASIDLSLARKTAQKLGGRLSEEEGEGDARRTFTAFLPGVASASAMRS